MRTTIEDANVRAGVRLPQILECGLEVGPAELCCNLAKFAQLIRSIRPNDRHKALHKAHCCCCHCYGHLASGSRHVVITPAMPGFDGAAARRAAAAARIRLLRSVKVRRHRLFAQRLSPKPNNALVHSQT